MNLSALTGRLTANPELRHTPNGSACTRFTIAVDRFYKGENHVDFIRIVAWLHTAEFICKHFTKGQKIEVNGSILTGSYVKDNRKVYTFGVLADSVAFAERKQDENQQEAEIEETNLIDNDDFEVVLSDDDLPF